jgi:hypothetical protein
MTEKTIRGHRMIRRLYHTMAWHSDHRQECLVSRILTCRRIARPSHPSVLFILERMIWPVILVALIR